MLRCPRHPRVPHHLCTHRDRPVRPCARHLAIVQTQCDRSALRARPRPPLGAWNCAAHLCECESHALQKSRHLLALRPLHQYPTLMPMRVRVHPSEAMVSACDDRGILARKGGGGRDWATHHKPLTHEAKQALLRQCLREQWRPPPMRSACSERSIRSTYLFAKIWVLWFTKSMSYG